MEAVRKTIRPAGYGLDTAYPAFFTLFNFYRMKLTTTHFIAVYSVECKSLATQQVRKDYCETEPRELKYLVPFLRSAAAEMVAVFLITPKQPEDANSL
jgi:hypothetical protein